MSLIPFIFSALLVLSVAPQPSDSTPDDRSPAEIGARSNACDPVTGCPSEIFAHTSRSLFRIDVSNNQPTAALVGNFGVEITDITRLADGTIYGVSFSALYQIDPSSARARLIGPLGANGINGLAASGNRLVASSTNGYLFYIDPSTGRASQVGRFGRGIVSSGDLCFGPNGVLFLTSPHGPSNATTDRLLRIDPVTGAATVLGDTGLSRIYGLTFTGTDMLGFTEAGVVVAIDPNTGAARQLATLGNPFWGSS